jgi:hypothetical protein
MIDPLLEIGPRVTALPIVHGSGDFAWEVRRIMMSQSFDCVALPLPPSFQSTVESAILDLPIPSIVVQRDRPVYQTQWTPSDEPSGEFNPDDSNDALGEDFDDEDDEEREPGVSFVPIDPCQPVIAAVRTAMGDHIPRRFIDMETSFYRPHSQVMPDAYALKRLPIERFAAAVLPNIEPGHNAQWRNRIRHMAWQLKELSVDFQNILFVTSILDWPWVRQAFQDRSLDCPTSESVEEVEHNQVDQDSLYFMLGELPFITDLYETARSELEDDENLAIDGVKELLIASRESYNEEYKSRARKITPKLLSQCLKYIRNLTLIDHRFTPQLTTIVTAAQQVAGDGYALHVLEKAKQYRFARKLNMPDSNLPQVRVSIDKIALPAGEVVSAANRLPGPPLQWCHLELVPKPDVKQQNDWKQKWNPYSQCSWPPEDDLIENFRQSVFDRAKEVMGADLAQTEKFTTSIKDGIDIRETVRHWYDNEIHVKVLPPNQGKLDAAVMLFDSPADPRDYPWRTTWFAEHKNESTLAFFATDFGEQPVGPGICLANYGGAMFLYPPIPIADIWQDPRLDFTTTMEERILAATCLHSQCPHIALVSPAPPGPAWRQLARMYKKTWVHLPLSRFSDSTVQQLRMVHVLNGREVRSYAADFIRRV